MNIAWYGGFCQEACDRIIRMPTRLSLSYQGYFRFDNLILQ